MNEKHVVMEEPDKTLTVDYIDKFTIRVVFKDNELRVECIRVSDAKILFEYAQDISE